MTDFRLGGNPTPRPPPHSDICPLPNPLAPPTMECRYAWDRSAPSTGAGLVPSTPACEGD